MKEIVSYCGLLCQGCPLYWATKEEDKEKKDRMRIKIAEICKEHYGVELKKEDITDCDGCLSESGRLFLNCKECSVRNCAVKKGVKNCAYRDEYACNKLKELFCHIDKSAEARLEVIRYSL